MTVTLHEKPAATSKSQFVKSSGFMVSLGRGGGGKSGGSSSAWTRRRVNWVSSCYLPALLARLQPLASLSFMAAQEKPGVEIRQMGRRPIGM